MSLEKLYSVTSRVFFGGSFLLVLIAVAEGAANVFGYTVLRDTYAPGRLLEFAGIAMIFVVVLLLRQIRESLRQTSGS